MAMQNKSTSKTVVRTAPSPVENAHVLNPIRQEYVIHPSMSFEDEEKSSSTAKDFQPKKEDMNTKTKRKKRAKNLVTGIVMFLLSLVILLPYILGVVDAQVQKLPFKFVPEQFDAIGNLISAFKTTASLGWKGEEVNAIWVNAVPSLVLVLGILFVLFNVIKSMFAMFAGVKPVKYAANSFVYLVCVLVIFIMALVGVPVMGIDKIDFVQDFIYGYKTSELFSLVVFAVGYFVISGIISLINREKKGY